MKTNKQNQGEVWIGRCTICGTVISASTYEAFRKMVKLHAKKCFKR